MDRLRQFFQQLGVGLGDAWQRLDMSARVNIGLAAAGTLIFVLGMLWWGTRAEFVRLYDGLSPDDSVAVRTALDDQGAPYRVRRNGAEVLVPRNRRSELILALQDQGLPNRYGAVPGFELFDQSDIMSNRYLQNITYMRALQGTLQNQLEFLSFVDRAWVMIREAEDSLFLSEQKPSEATVQLQVNARPTSRQIRAMVSMIAAFGGANLDGNHITITTTDGEPLHLPPRDEFASVANSKLEHKLEVESAIERKIREALNTAGVRSVITVSAGINHDRRTERRYETTDAAVLSSMTSTSSTTSTESLPEGAPGVQANLPAGALDNREVSLTEETTERLENFDPSTTTTEVVTTPGSIERLRVMALIEQRFVPVFDDEGNLTGQYEREEFDENRYRAIIAAAAGVEALPDDIVVHPHIFETRRMDETRELVAMVDRPVWQTGLLEYGPLALQVLVLVVGLVMVRRFLLGSLLPVEEAPDDEDEAAEARPEDITRGLTQNIEDLAQQDPALVASLLRTWMTESEQTGASR